MIRTRRILSGLLLGGAGIVFTIVAVMIAQAAQDQSRLIERNYQVADVSCREQAQKIGAIREIDGGKVWELQVPVVVDKRTALGDASAAISACPTRAMQFFCLGSGCADPEGTRPPATVGRRPSSMVMRLALRPGMVAAQQIPVGQTNAAPRPVGANPQAIRPPGVQSPPQPQPARPAQPAQQVPARALPGVVQPQTIPQVR